MVKTHKWMDGKLVVGEVGEINVGDVITFTCNGAGRGGHYGVTATVTKVKAKTFDATERERSYRPGTLWNLRKSDESVRIMLTWKEAA